MSGHGDQPVHRAAAVGFDRVADAYDRARPSYPDEAVAHVVGRLGLGPGTRVLDLAAGTGIFTRLLVPSGADVVAVEPVAGMRDVLTRTLPGIECLEGTAEALPVADASLDGVVCAQAFHWFDAPAALAEIRRVLRPGGGLAVVFNVRDESVDWVRELTERTGVYEADRPHHTPTRARFAADIAAAGGYTPVEVATFRHEQELDEELLVERVRSQSWIGAMAPAEQEAVLDQVRDLTRTHPDLAGRDRFSLPYDTEVRTCHRA